MMINVNIIVRGKVQGVGFRYFAKDLAIMYNISGWVRNNNNGTVELEISGENETVERFVSDLKTKHPYAKVTDIELQSLPYNNHYQDFKITY